MAGEQQVGSASLPQAIGVTEARAQQELGLLLCSALRAAWPRKGGCSGAWPVSPGRSLWLCRPGLWACSPGDNSERTGWWPPCPVPAGWGLLSWPERPISLSLLDSLDLRARCSCDASTPPASPSECGPQWTELGGDALPVSLGGGPGVIETAG